MTALETLPTDAFRHILELCDGDFHFYNPLPVCSTSMNTLWSEVIQQKKKEMERQFVREFDLTTSSSSATQRYYQIATATQRFKHDIATLNSITKDEYHDVDYNKVIKRVGRLLRRNPIRESELRMLETVCGALVPILMKIHTTKRYPRQQRLHPGGLPYYLGKMKGVSKSDTLERAIQKVSTRLLNNFRTVASRMKERPAGGERERTLYLEAMWHSMLCCYLNGNRDEKFSLARQVLLVDPMDYRALWYLVEYHCRERNPEGCFETIQACIRSMSSDPKAVAGWILVPGRFVYRKRRFFGTERSMAMLLETVAALKDLLSGSESIDEQDRIDIVEAKATVERYVSRIQIQIQRDGTM